MSYLNRFIPHSVLLTGNVAGWINQIESTDIEAGVSLFEESSGSQTDTEFVAIREISPTIPIVTSDLSTLALCGMSGAWITSTSAPGGLIAYGRLLPLGGLPAPIATAEHISVACSDGLLMPVSIRASHNQAAKLQLMLHAYLGTTSGGGTYHGAAPLVRTDDVTISAGAGGTVNLYTAGPVQITPASGQGSEFLCQGIADLGVDFGIQVLKESTDGEVDPTHVSIIGRAPKIQFTTKDIEVITTIGDGIAVSNCGAYFRAISQGGQRAPAANSVHIGVTGTAGMITPGAATLRHKTPGTAAFTFTPSLTSTVTTILTISTTASIPTS